MARASRTRTRRRPRNRNETRIASSQTKTNRITPTPSPSTVIAITQRIHQSTRTNRRHQRSRSGTLAGGLPEATGEIRPAPHNTSSASHRIAIAPLTSNHPNQPMIMSMMMETTYGVYNGGECGACVAIAKVWRLCSTEQQRTDLIVCAHGLTHMAVGARSTPIMSADRNRRLDGDALFTITRGQCVRVRA